jgi:WD40 repeat protein
MAMLASHELSVICCATHQVVATFATFFGGFTCAVWDPTSRYLLAGAEDDSVYILSVAKRRPVGRLVGHRAPITAIAFDPWNSSSTLLCFASVGKDGMLLVWELAFNLDETCPDGDYRFLNHQVPKIFERTLRTQALAGILFTPHFLIIPCTTGQTEVFLRTPADPTPAGPSLSLRTPVSSRQSLAGLPNQPES